jgi:hypothetical protein
MRFAFDWCYVHKVGLHKCCCSRQSRDLGRRSRWTWSSLAIGCTARSNPSEVSGHQLAPKLLPSHVGQGERYACY